MDWLRLDADFPFHPKVMRLARRLGSTRERAVLALVHLWCWARRFADEGNLCGYDDQEIAEAACWDGSPGELVRSLIESKWLDETEDGLVLHGWEERQSRRALDRAQASERQRKHRHGTVTLSRRDTVTVTNDVTQSVTPTGQDRTLQDKTKADVALPPAPLPAGVPFVDIPIRGGMHTVTEQDVAEYEAAFPTIDVRQILRQIRQWNVDRPGQRKSPRGVRKHISGWLARDERENAPQRRTERLEAIPDPEADRDPFREASEQVCRLAVPNLERSIVRLGAEGNTVAVEQMRTSLESARRRLGELERTTV